MKKQALFLTTSLISFLPLSTIAAEVKAVSDDMYVAVDADHAHLGQLLFWDPILSGNKNISCGTCHHPKLGTADGLALPLGEGGIGLGDDRDFTNTNVPEQRISRNAPALFNLGAKEFTVLFKDGKLEPDTSRESGLRTPLEDDMAVGFSSILSAQTMFPVLNPDEMAGHYSENEIAQAVRLGLITGEGGAWDLISKRVSAIGEYQAMFEAIDPEIAAGKPIDFTNISDALAEFISFEWRSDDSPYDNYLRGKVQLDEVTLQGMDLFYGKANCASCHSGPFQTDHKFHAMGVPQIGPGTAERFESHSQDLGRMEVTGKPEDAYAFRTPSLRNVTLTAPYGHSGAYRNLRSFLEAHIDPANAIENYDRSEALLGKFTPEKNDWIAFEDPNERQAIKDAVAWEGVSLDTAEIDALMAFMRSLEDRKSLTTRFGVPVSVPSGLQVESRLIEQELISQ